MKPADITIGCDHYPPRNVLSLEQLWKDKLKQNSCEIFVKQLTMRDRGMLKHFIRFVSPHDPYAVMGTVLNDWYEYVHSVRYSAGLAGVPSKPSIPFLLTYCGEAVNFHLKVNKAKVTSMSKPEPVAKAVDKLEKFKQEIAAMPEEKKTTMGDILALEKELGL